MSRRVVVLLALLALNMISAIGVVESTEKTRQLFYQLQVARSTHDRLTTEWSQIRLENSTLASPDRIAQVAHNQLGMIQPHDYVVLGDGH